MWHFFTNPNDDFYNKWRNNAILIVCNEDGGYFISRDGDFIDGKKLCPWFRFQINLRHKKISLKQAIELINPKKREKLFSELGISINDTVLTDEIKNSIIDKLKEKRAFGPDSAYKFEDSHFHVLSMAEQKLIKTTDYQKFYIEKI